MSGGELIFLTILGIACGVITGIVPGIHVNLVTVLVVSFSGVLVSWFSPLGLGVFLISLAITHTFLDNIPGIYLGAPDAGQELNVLPGHRLLLRGEGHNALLYTLMGSLGALLLCVISLPLLIWLMAVLASWVQRVVGFLLIGIMAYMIAKDRKKWLQSLTLFLLAGCLGLVVFSLPSLQQPLFPLLSGLFGTSLLMVSLWQKSSIPPQQKKPLSLSLKNMSKAVSAASGMGFVAGFLPGFGSSQAAIVATNMVGDIGDEGFLALVGGINTANMLVSIGTAYAIDKARNGAIVGVMDLLGTITLPDVLIFVAVSLVAGGLATLLAISLSKTFATYITRVHYPTMAWSIIIFVTLLAIVFDGWIGLTILLTATALGLLAASWNVGKNHLLGCLILPVILYFML